MGEAPAEPQGRFRPWPLCRGRTDLPGGVVAGEHVIEPPQGACRQPVAGTQEQRPVSPGQVAFAAPAAQLLTSHALRTFVTVRLASRTSPSRSLVTQPLTHSDIGI